MVMQPYAHRQIIQFFSMEVSVLRIAQIFLSSLYQYVNKNCHHLKALVE